MKDYLGYIIPLVSVFLSYICGRLQSRESQKVAIKKERYDKFYAPFIAHLYAGRMDKVRYSSLSLDVRGKFFDLLFQNIQYIGENTQSYLIEFYDAFLNYSEYESGRLGYEDSPQYLDAAFTKIAGSVLLEASKLSQSLHLPQLGKTFSAQYLTTKCTQTAIPNKH